MPDKPKHKLAYESINDGTAISSSDDPALVLQKLVGGDRGLSRPNRTAHTVMVTFRAPHELDRRLTALAKAQRTTKTALLLDAAEALLDAEEPGSAVEAATTRQAVGGVEIPHPPKTR